MALVALLAAARVLRNIGKPPEAVAYVRGGPLAPEISGTIRFQETQGGVRVTVEVEGLPPYAPATPGRAPIGPHGFHIHEKGDCTVGDATDPFLAAGGHFDDSGQPHGNHAGDFPVLFSNAGRASMTFFTSRLSVAAILGRAVIIHENPDDYRTQPAGASGKRLACGVIQRP
ncbi:MAG: superoxide dismutase family protein [Limnochordaceae bacterium]|nr:superoxide dismutase family protein [Limnochordaceae bacterium]